MKNKDYRLVTGPGHFALLVRLSEVDAKVKELQSKYLGEAGATFHGEAMAEKGFVRGE
ncbi:MAG: hypothetical protein ABIY37_01470 [Devosia sp.]